jgi:Short-chain dehydrogenases of various substrate specificities
MKKVIIVGATSGIGHELAIRYINKGYTVGVAGRRTDELDKLVHLAEERVFPPIYRRNIQ